MDNITIDYYKNELNSYIKLYPNWKGKIIRKNNINLYNWYKEIINGRRKLNNMDKDYFLKKGLDLTEMVCDFNNNKSFMDWVNILEEYLNVNYYYGIKNNFRSDKKHISEWDGTLKRSAGNFNNNNLYKWYENIKKRKKLKEHHKKILENLGLRLSNIINKRLKFEEWIKLLKEYISLQDNWSGRLRCNTIFKGRNLYAFINSLRNKSISNERKKILSELKILY